jgi:hypothetical protein
VRMEKGREGRHGVGQLDEDLGKLGVQGVCTLELVR